MKTRDQIDERGAIAVACRELPWETAPHGVVSLMDILRFYADIFIKAFSEIHSLEEKSSVMDYTQPNTRADQMRVLEVYAKVSAFATDCYEHGLGSANAKCERISKFLHDRNQVATYGELKNILVDLRERLEDDLGKELFLHLLPSDAKNYENPADGWENIIRRFPRIRHDVEESSKCFALSRYAASLFHVLLIAEFGVIEVAKLLQVQGDKPGWAALDRLQRVNDKKWSDKTDLEKKHSELLGKMMPLMLAMKNEWRHKIKHVDNKLEFFDTDFSPEVAKGIISATRGFMDVLATDLPK